MSIGDGRHQPCLIVSGFVERLEISIYTRWPCAGEASFRFLVDLLEAELELESDPFNAVFGSPAEVEGALGPTLRPHSQTPKVHLFFALKIFRKPGKKTRFRGPHLIKKTNRSLLVGKNVFLQPMVLP